jgi:4'-phosphopantetheinyl transferase
VRVGAHEIHLWCTFFDEISDAALLADYRRILTAAELEQERRFYFERDRKRYLVTRAMVRTVLSRYAPVAPDEWRFRENAYGKPEIDNDAGTARRISFNLSHTHSAIVLAVADGVALGVDIENVQAREVSTDLAAGFFAPDEVAALSALPAHRQRRRFFEYWTLKESYIKARGMGLSIPLDEFSFEFPAEDAIRIHIARTQNDLPTRWRFWQFQPGVEYLAALCAERVDAICPRLALRKIVPLRDEQEMEYRPVRASRETPSAWQAATGAQLRGG